VATYAVAGPLTVPLHKGRVGRLVRAQEGKTFFKTHPSFASRRGVYAFAMKAGRGITPVYVGKAAEGFGQECFQPHKLGKCNEALADYEKGTLVVFLICVSAGAGKPPRAEIEDVEDFFIQAGVSVNSDLLNVKGTRRATWKITGVIRADRGKPSKPAAALKKTFKL
jgi:hypothetical protein